MSELPTSIGTDPIAARDLASGSASRIGGDSLLPSISSLSSDEGVSLTPSIFNKGVVYRGGITLSHWYFLLEYMCPSLF